MCLRLKSEKTRVKTIKKDIVVYKALNVNTKINPERSFEVKHGDSFKGIIKGIECEGKISINKGGNIFFCTDNPNLDRCFTNDMIGYKHSWVMSEAVTEIIVNGKVINIGRVIGYETPYQYMKVEMGETYTSDLINLGKRVEIGLHSFKTMKYAKSVSSIVAKCIIPKGSQYYEGMFGSYASYASDCLTYVEIIK